MPKNVLDQNSQSNALIAYQALVNLYTSEGETTWSRFNAMVIAHSIFVLTASQLFTIHAYIAIPFLSLFGIFLSIVWKNAYSRGVQWQHYWMQAAREIEEKYISEYIQVFTKGEDFRDGRSVYFQRLKTSPRNDFSLKMKQPYFFRINLISFWTNLVFIISYLLLGSLSLLALLKIVHL